MTANFTYTSLGWSVTVYEANIGLNDTIAMAQTLVNTPSEQSWVKTEVRPISITMLPAACSISPSTERTLPGTTMNTETDNFAVTATGTLVIPAAGTYTFGCDSDDGFSLTITGATFSSVTVPPTPAAPIRCNTTVAAERATPWASSRSPRRQLPDQPPVVPRQRRCGVRAVRRSGQLHRLQLDHGLVGDTADGGLGMVSSSCAPLRGRRQSAVYQQHLARVDGHRNRSGRVGDRPGQRHLLPRDQQWRRRLVAPQGEISPLGTGTYDVAVIGTNAAGTLAFDSTVNELTVGTGTPTVSVHSLVPQTARQFAEHYVQRAGFRLQRAEPAIDLNAASPLEGATLSTTDNQHWTLGNLSGLTGTAGTYNLTVTAAGLGITDAFGDPLMNNAGTSWTRAYPLVQSIDTGGSTITNASSVQYAVASTRA